MIDISKKILYGPFKQALPMTDLPLKGGIKDDQLTIKKDVGIVVNGDKFLTIGPYAELKKIAKSSRMRIHQLEGDHIVLPGYVDAHTHICFGGNRARDFAMRNSGSTYLEIAAKGGGIWDSVTQTRQSSKEELKDGIVSRAKSMMLNGTTTIEVKSGYGLSVEEELKMLESINECRINNNLDLVPTCLAAHIVPKEYKGKAAEYLDLIIKELFPLLKEKRLANRVDAFIEQEAYTPKVMAPYFEKAIDLGFDITVHADQFTPGGSEVAVRYGALSADHLEASTEIEIKLLSQSDVIPVALPGATLGLGCAFTPARKLLDAGCSLAIASDYNPGSAPMGDLITQASILSTFQKLSAAEVFAGITYRAAAALNKTDIGKIEKGYKANLAIYQTDNYQNILYKQGQLKPSLVVYNGKPLF